MVEKTSNLNQSGDYASSGKAPESFPAPTVVLFSKRRAVFSKSVFRILFHRIEIGIVGLKIILLD